MLLFVLQKKKKKISFLSYDIALKSFQINKIIQINHLFLLILLDLKFKCLKQKKTGAAGN